MQKNDYFGLNSDDEEESSVLEKRKEEGIKKWDWDKDENRDLYYTKPSFTTKGIKRTIVPDYDSDDDNLDITEPKMTKLNNQDKNIQKKTSIYIETVSGATDDQTCKLKYNLIGHTSSVNRVHWTRQSSNKNKLLSSSMDG